MTQELSENIGWGFIVTAICIEIYTTGHGDLSLLGVCFSLIGLIMIVITNETK